MSKAEVREGAAKHTPGPWAAKSVTTDGVIGRKVYIHSVEHMPIDEPLALMIADEREGANPEANARLIAAAPEMLEALEAVNDALIDGRLVGDPTKMLPPSEEFKKHVQLIAKVQSALYRAAGGPE